MLCTWTQRETRTNPKNPSSWSKEKKRKYQQRVMVVRMGSCLLLPLPTPLAVFGTNGGMGKKCKLFLSNLADKLFRNNGESYASAISWLETCISFEILTSLHTCLRGSRTPFHKNADFLDDFSVNARNEDILKLTLVCFFRVVLVDSIFISWL